MIYKNKNCYTEDVENSLFCKQDYLYSLKKLIKNGQRDAKAVRDSYMSPEKLFANTDYYRKQFLDMMGVPRFNNIRNIPKVHRKKIGQDDMCQIYRVAIEVVDDFLFYGILLLPHGSKNSLPLVIAQHGGGGTPEYCCDMYGENNYSHFTKLALEEGCIVFAPQLLLWSFDIETGEKFPKFDLPFNRMLIDRQLSKLGMGIIGFEMFCIMRSIDWLSSLDIVNSDKIGMMGLSYGGFYSLYTAAADTRIKSIYSAAVFNDRDIIFLDDFIRCGQSYKFHDAEVVGLCCPRMVLIDVGKNDPVFDGKFASDEAVRAEKYYIYKNSKQNFNFNLWNGKHQFDIASGNFDKFFNSLKQ